jgi:hypothetical protein
MCSRRDNNARSWKIALQDAQTDIGLRKLGLANFVPAIQEK